MANPSGDGGRYPASDRIGSTPRDRVLPATRALCMFIVPFLLVAFVLLYFWPSADDTGRLFAWRIAPDFTSMMLASAYLGGAYFFARAVAATQWHRIGGGFLPVVLFSGLLGVATVLHWDRFVHGNVGFWLWAGLYFTAPLLVLLAWWSNRSQSPPATVDDVLLAGPEVAVIAAAGVLACVTAVVLFVLPGWAATVWPWPLTPLTSRVVGSIFALGFAAVQVLADRRWTSARLLVQVALIMLGLMTVAAVRTLGDFAADRPLTWLLAAGLVGSLVGLAALYGRREISRAGSRTARG
ncbi:hypothetical protein [Nakamurella sp.]|uniref:hypothetical protein n=1 Tax=Nakamurella sp. TaxID=1869182 RepID=UPI003783E4E0